MASRCPHEPHGVLMLAESEAELAGELARCGSSSQSCAPEALAPGEPAALEPRSRRRSPACGCTPATRSRPPRRPARSPRARPPPARGSSPGPRWRSPRGGVIVDGAHRAGGRGRRRGRPVDAGAGRPVRRLAADRAAVGRRRGGPAGDAAAARARGGGHRGACRPARRSAAALQPRHDRRRVGARLDLPARAPGRGRARAAAAPSAAPASSPRSPRPRPASVRACARPLSADGLPLLGRAPGRDDVFVAAGHGPVGRLARPRLGPARRRPRAAAAPPARRRRSIPAASRRPGRRTMACCSRRPALKQESTL